MSEDIREQTLAVGRAARASAHVANLTAAVASGVSAAARWPNGPGPITHGTSTTMAGRCATENGGRACATCLAANAARMAAYKRRRRQRDR